MNRKSFIWNMLGSGIYAAATILFVMIAKRCAGVEAGSRFYMAFTTGQMLLTVGYFEMRPFQSTDVGFQYSADDYFGFRAITGALMMVCVIPVVLVYGIGQGTPASGLALIALMTAYKLMDAVSDVFEGEFQRRERMDLAGKSMFLRVLAGMVVFTLLCIFTKNVLIASAGMFVTAVIMWLVIDIPWMRKFGPVRLSWDKQKLISLFQSTILLFLGSMMCNWIWNGTKYVVEWNFDAEATLIYGIVFMPTMVINLGSGFLFKPMLTDMAKEYEQKDFRKFGRTVGILCGGVAAITLICLIGAWFLGVPVLGWVYAVDLAPYKAELLILLAGGGLNAMGIIFYYCLTVMRRMKLIFAGYLVTLALSFFLPIYMSKQWGLMGTSLSYVIVMAVLLAIHGLMTLIILRKESRK